MSAEETNLLKQPPLTASPVESCSVKELSRECVTGINTPVRRVRRPHLSTRTKEKASKVAVVATVIAVLGLFTIPFIVHFVKVSTTNHLWIITVGYCAIVSCLGNRRQYFWKCECI